MDLEKLLALQSFIAKMGLTTINGYSFYSPLSGGGSNITAIYKKGEKKAVAKFFFIGPHPNANKKFKNELENHHNSRRATEVLPAIYAEFSCPDGFVKGYLMEHISGPSLESILSSKKKHSIDEALMTFYRIGWAYQHTLMGLVHGDLHPGNIIFETPLDDWIKRKPDSPEVRIIDLGASISPFIFTYKESFDEELWNDFRKRYSGSFYSLAPEFFSADFHKRLIYGGGKFDCWSLGLLLYRMLTGTLLDIADSLGEYVDLIAQGKLQKKIANQIESHQFEHHLEFLLKKMLWVDSTDRIELVTAVAYAHQFYSREPNLIKKNGETLERYVRHGCMQDSYLGLPPHEWENSPY